LADETDARSHEPRAAAPVVLSAVRSSGQTAHEVGLARQLTDSSAGRMPGTAARTRYGNRDRNSDFGCDGRSMVQVAASRIGQARSAFPTIQAT
jgi:hypothetical protein